MARYRVVSTVMKAKWNPAAADITTPMHTDRREVIGWNPRLSAAGDWERYTFNSLC
jgi:hypothetical protein